MDFLSILNENFVLVVFLACLIMGYVIKTSLNQIPNKYIPTILAVAGAILNSIVTGLSIDSFVYGAFMGLASTGAHQAFTRFIEKMNDNEEIEV